MIWNVAVSASASDTSPFPDGKRNERKDAARSCRARLLLHGHSATPRRGERLPIRGFSGVCEFGRVEGEGRGRRERRKGCGRTDRKATQKQQAETHSRVGDGERGHGLRLRQTRRRCGTLHRHKP